MSRWNLVYFCDAFWGFISTLPISLLLCQQILERLSSLCVSHAPSGKKNRKHEQRLLRNMGAHTVVLELLQIPYEKVVFFKYATSYVLMKRNHEYWRTYEEHDKFRDKIVDEIVSSYPTIGDKIVGIFFPDEVLWRTKQSAPSPLSFILRWGCSLFLTGSSHSATRLHKGGGEGKASYPLLKLVRRHEGP